MYMYTYVSNYTLNICLSPYPIYSNVFSPVLLFFVSFHFQEIHDGLMSKSDVVKKYVPYQRTTAPLRLEVQALEAKLKYLKQR